ncbi:hypothetical protein J3E72DRAFT_416396 [Bipolaris maydis]|nr:hypothetical protein J3E72DRAFT_416396 [Bipolaris maydis]
MSGWFTLFTNCRYVLNGELVEDHLVISDETGFILKREGYIGGEAIDLEDAIIAPGFLELHTNGTMATQGVTGFWATLPTIQADEFQKILPSLTPRDIASSASLLGAHNSSLFQPCDVSPATVYGSAHLRSAIRLVTVAPELPDSANLIKSLTSQGIRVAMGHSTATYEQGLAGLSAGASGSDSYVECHAELGIQSPSLAGLVSLPETAKVAPPWYTIIADGEHLHPNTVSLLYRSSPKRSIVITDSIELASLKDGTYPGHSQIPFEQVKSGTRATIAGTDTLIGGCIPLQQSMRNLMIGTGCSIAEAVGTVTENVAAFMGIDGKGGRGILQEGRRADLTVLM